MQFTSNIYNYFEPFLLKTFAVEVKVLYQGTHEHNFRGGVQLVRGVMVDLKCPWFLVCAGYTSIGLFKSDYIDFQAPFIEVLPLPEWCEEGRVWECPLDIYCVDEINKLAKKMCVARNNDIR